MSAGASPSSMLLDERIDEDGASRFVRLSRGVDGSLALVVERAAQNASSEPWPLPPGAVEAVMKRYGKPLESGSVLRGAVESLALDRDPATVEADAGARTLVRFRHLARFDVVARDYLALVEPGAETICELATAVTSALFHLARAFSTPHR